MRLYGEYGKNENGYWMYMGNELYDLVNYDKLSVFKFWLYRVVDFIGSGGNIIWQKSDTCVVCKNDTKIDDVSEYIGDIDSGKIICNNCKGNK